MNEERSYQILSGFGLKILAILTMTLDHVGFFLMNRYFGVNDGLYQMAYVFRCIGRIAFPLFAFMAAEGAHFSHKPWNYFFKMLGLHLIISVILSIYVYAIPGAQFGPADIGGNAFADLTLIVLTLVLFRQKSWKKALAVLPIGFAVMVYVIQLLEYSQNITITWFPRFLRPDYSLMGLLMGIAFYFCRPLADRISGKYVATMGMTLDAYQLTRSYRKLTNLLAVSFLFAIVVVFWGISYIGYSYNFRPYDNYLMQLQTYCLIAIVPLYLYSGKRGYDSKSWRWISYLYYPVHMAILFLIFSI